jgi:putative addiction module component (TIGR02574 family)
MRSTFVAQRSVEAGLWERERRWSGDASGSIASVDFPPRRTQFLAVALANFPELTRLPRRTRLKIAEELWDSAVSDDLPVPASHKTLIRTRRAAYERGEMKTVAMAELKRTIRRKS